MVMTTRPNIKPKELIGHRVRVETYGYSNHFLDGRIGTVTGDENATHCLVEFEIDGRVRTFAVDVRDILIERAGTIGGAA